jgi:hypothetical protein
MLPEPTRPRGLVKKELGAIDSEMKLSTAPTEFKPFRGSWAACAAKLHELQGRWRDHRRKGFKTYQVTVFAEGYANVLSELSDGTFRQGSRLVQIRKLTYAEYVIMWSESYVLEEGAGGESLQWLPVCETTHTPYFWWRP